MQCFLETNVPIRCSGACVSSQKHCWNFSSYDFMLIL